MYTVGIIGAGSIGAMKPDHIDSPATEIPLTHAHAVYSDNNFKLLWVYDKSVPAMQQANKKWSCSRSFSLDPVDVLVIATPTNTHLEQIQKICMANKKDRPRLIILEKPAGSNIHEATKIDYLTKEFGIKVVVNYGRRFCNFIIDCASEIKKREKIQSIVFHYTRGFVRDGSHAIDMFNLFAGTFTDGTLLPNPIIDHDEKDPTYSAVMEYSKCPKIFLVAMDGREYDIFEMEVRTDQATWSFSDHFKRLCFTSKRKEETYGDYYSMPAPDNHLWQSGLEYSLKNLYESVYDYLARIDAGDIPNPKPLCGMKEAIRVHSVINRLMIKKQIEEGEKK